MLRIKSMHDSGKSGENISAEELGSRINAYLEAEDYAAAYPLLVRLTERPKSGMTAHSIAGVAAMRLGQTENARKHFLQCLKINPQNYDAMYNVALADMLTGRYNEASRQFRKLVISNPLDAPLRNDLGAAFAEENRRGRALASFSKALKLDPNFSQARNNAIEHCLKNNLLRTARNILAHNERCDSLSAVSRAEIDRWKEILDLEESESTTPDWMTASGRFVAPSGTERRLAFFATHDTFVTEIRKELESEYEIRLYDGGSVDSMAHLMDWADICWFEWCDNLIIQASRLPKRSVILCRLHSYEAFTDMPDKVNWSNVDHLLFVNDSVRRLVEERVPRDLPNSVIHNGVNLDRFTLPENKTTSKNIASVGYINYKKNPTLLLYCFKKLHETDPEYTLHIAGSHQDPRIQLYFEHFLQKNPLPVHFDGWIDDMPGWYADKGWVVSTSLFESFHYSIAEGMASGLIPLIHNWFGADQLYPTDFLFDDPDQFVNLIQSIERKDKAQLVARNRDFITEKYDHKRKMDEIRVLLNRVYDCRHKEAEAFTPL